LWKARHEKKISVFSAAYEGLCRLKSVSWELNGIAPAELQKFKKMFPNRFCFRSKRLIAEIKNVIAPSGVRKALLRVKGSQRV
jgi:hypothetical protein